MAVPHSPFGDSFGGQQRTALLLRALQRHGDVDVVMVREADRDGVVAAPEAGVHAALEWRPRAGGINRFAPAHALVAPVQLALGRSLADYDLAVGHHLYPLCKLPCPAHVPTLVDLDDISPLLWSGRCDARAMVDLARQVVGRTLANRQLDRFDHYLFVSQRDRDRLPGLRGDILPNAPRAVAATPDFDRPSLQILFVGALWYRPNADAMDWFTSAVWPTVRRAVPEARLLIVGAASPEVREHWNRIDGVRAPGFVDDLSEAYRDSAFAISPTRLGGGSNIKVPEALAHGRTCVLTPFSLAGFRGLFESGRELLMAVDAKDFARTCIELLGNPERRAALARAGHATVARELAPARSAAIIDAAIAATLSRRAAPVLASQVRA
ncbi:glycosyltransferase family 4 protein [Uliginosibacterium sp. sgz301328]|uniref:glycosyltransferase family 4 protein n=1 Tax=Uliginosibacterium sp. sgz301328 TaxID=3243764 RepID=UPI00359DC9F0